MALRLEQITAQVTELSQSLTADQRRRWLQEARRLLREVDGPTLSAKLARRGSARVPWLVAQPLGSLHERTSPRACPPDFSVIAADGSNIPPDRHSPVRYYVINTGVAVLTYGRSPAARLEAQAVLYHQDEALYFDPITRLQPVEGNRLSARMAVAELQALQAAACSVPTPAIALVDGSLILWSLQSEPAEIRTQLLGEYLTTLDWFARRRIPVAGYISDPGSFELANALRVYLCPESPAECQRCWETTAGELRLCYELHHFRDPALLFGMLNEDERTCLFASSSQILQEYGPQAVRFFYLRAGDEIVRVEVPAWAADDPELLDLVHTLICDQCRRSGWQPPYPPALHEAHEQAVISSADRELVDWLIEEELGRRGVTFLKSAKARHKRSRGV